MGTRAGVADVVPVARRAVSSSNEREFRGRLNAKREAPNSKLQNSKEGKEEKFQGIGTRDEAEIWNLAPEGWTADFAD